ncbi:hypothetical protein ACSTH7_24870 [Vibrio parahaemolyticus]
MLFLKDNWIRLLYGGISVLILGFGIHQMDTVIGESSLNSRFSYLGTLFTVIGLIVAVCEVWHSVNVAKSVRDQAKELVERVKTVETASAISDCVSYINETNKNVINEDYKVALSHFHAFRSVYVKLSMRDDTQVPKVLLSSVEKTILKATRTSIQSPFDKKQKDELVDKILEIKDILELANPANGSSE